MQQHAFLTCEMGEIDREAISRHCHQFPPDVPSRAEKGRKEEGNISLVFRDAVWKICAVTSSIIAEHMVVTEVKCKKYPCSFLEGDSLIGDADDSELVISRILVRDSRPSC